MQISLQKVLVLWHLMVPLEEQNHGAGESRGGLKWQYWGRSWGIHSASTAETPGGKEKGEAFSDDAIK